MVDMVVIENKRALIEITDHRKVLSSGVMTNYIDATWPNRRFIKDVLTKMTAEQREYFGIEECSLTPKQIEVMTKHFKNYNKFHIDNSFTIRDEATISIDDMFERYKIKQ